MHGQMIILMIELPQVQLQCSMVLRSLLQAPALPVIFETGLPSVDP